MNATQTPPAEVLAVARVRRSAEAVTEGQPLNAYMGHCGQHDMPVREDMPEGTRATTRYRMITCFASGTVHQIRGERMHGLTTALECDPSCRSARLNSCSCGCGGANHGNTWTRGKFLSHRTEVEAAVIAMRADQAKRRLAAEKASATRAAKKATREAEAFTAWLAADEKITALVNWLTGPHDQVGNFLAAMVAKVERHEILTPNMINVCRNVYREEAQRARAVSEAHAAPRLDAARNGQPARADEIPAPRPGAGDQATLTTPGVYKLGTDVYVVKGNRNYLAWRKAMHAATKAGQPVPARPSDANLYAKQLKESAPRMTEAGTEIPFELVYAPGVIRRLALSDMMPRAEAEELSTRYARCIVCGHSLKAAKSVRAGIGPVCGSYFRD